MKRRKFLKMGFAAGIGLALPKAVYAQGVTPPPPGGDVELPYQLQHRVTVADRRAAAKRLKAAGLKPGAAGTTGLNAAAVDNSKGPHYFGPYPNYANSPLPRGPVSSLEVVAGGSGYSDTPTVEITDVYGTGTGAAATATVVGGVITSVTLTNPGSGYSAPWVSITDASGEGAEIAAVIGSGLEAGTGIRKFVDSLAPLGVPGSATPNTLGQYIPVAIPEEYTSPIDGSKSDYYEIAVIEYTQKLHQDLPPTRLRGYVQLSTASNPGLHVELKYPDGTPIMRLGSQVYGYDEPRYLGPQIIAKRDRAVRIKFVNLLPTGMGGDLFIPVDTTVMGAGMGPMGHMDHGMGMGMEDREMMYTQNRATIHLHGAFIPWISDGTPHQWITPANETTHYPHGVSVANVPDMDDPGPGAMTFYYNNQQSARLMFYHDHSQGITRLNVYAGEAAGYLITDTVEDDLINGSNVHGFNPNNTKALPGVGIPLVIQDRTFVDAATVLAQDPNWRWGLDANGQPVTGSLWLPNVYMPAQNPWDMSGANAFGRWHYGPWFWPPTTDIAHPPIPNPYYGMYDWEPPYQPDQPNPSMGMEAFMDTPMVNGTVYPYLEVDPTVVRFRILNAANDRFFNLQLYIADPDVMTDDGRENTEVRLVPAVSNPDFPDYWPADNREGGVPDPAMAGPDWIQIGTEGGFLPAPVVIPTQPISWNANATLFNVGNVQGHSLLLGCAERADVLVDFSPYAGQTLILYNDAPAAFPALDPRYDYYTGNPDQTPDGGTPPTQPGFGPNTRTIMQIRVKSPDGAAGAGVANVTVTAGGSDYLTAPEVVFTGGNGTGAAATATCSIDHITVLNPGSGYTTAAVEISGDGTGAEAQAVLLNGRIQKVVLTNKGAGYTQAPTITITGDGTGATAESRLTVSSVTVTDPGSGYLFAPAVRFLGSGGYDASAVAKLIVTGTPYDLPALEEIWRKTDTKPGVFESCQDPIIIPQFYYNSAYNTDLPVDTSGFVQQHDFSRVMFSGGLSSVQLTSGGTGYTAAPTVNVVGGGGSGAVVTATISGATVNGVTLTNRGSGYSFNPTVTISGGTGSGARASATITRIVTAVNVTNGGSGYTSAPTVRFTGGFGNGAAATAIVSGGRVTSVLVTSNGSGYFFAPSVSFVGGGGSGARATAVLTGVVNTITVTNGGSGYSTTSLPTVTISGGGGSGATATASVLAGFVSGLTLVEKGAGYSSEPMMTFTGGGGSGAAAKAIGVVIPIQPKAIQDEMGEAYDLDYGRMSGFLGLELPVTNSVNQNFTLYGYSSPPVDILQNAMTPLGVLDDGTQIWKITQNGVDTHPMHFHLVNVQLINRVAWDGMLLPPEPNELGWKETVRTNPLEHIIVAMRSVTPTQPFEVPNSVRPIDPNMPLGVPVMAGPIGWVDPTGQAAPVINHEINFGWEYVWHCHILSHEEMDMMHSLCFAVQPKAPSNLKATFNYNQRRVTLTWTNTANNATGFIVERATSANGPWMVLSDSVPTPNSAGGTATYVENNVMRNRTYFYRVTAVNTVGDTTIYAAPAVGYPTVTVKSVNNPAISIATNSSGNPGVPVTLIFANSFDNGTTEWAGMVGNVQAAEPAAIGADGGQFGLAAQIGAALAPAADDDAPACPAYVFDANPNMEKLYDASFYFHPNGASSGKCAVDIFAAMNQDDAPIFGIQYSKCEGEEEYKLRGWVLVNGEPAFTDEVEITNAPHRIEIAWASATKGGMSLFVDDIQVGKTIMGDTSKHAVNLALLGPSMGLTSTTSGTMYFDDFSSSRISAVQASWVSFFPFIGKK